MTPQTAAEEIFRPLELDLRLIPSHSVSTGSVTVLDEDWTPPPASAERPTGRYSTPPTFADPFGIYEDVLRRDIDQMGTHDVAATQVILVTRSRLFILFARERLAHLRSGKTRGSVESLVILSYVLFHLGIPYSEIEADFTQAEFFRLRARVNAHLMEKIFRAPPGQIDLSHLALAYGEIACETPSPQPELPWVIQADRNAHVSFATDLVHRLRSNRGSRGILLLLQEAVRVHHIDMEQDLALSQSEYAHYCLAYGCSESP
jgi:hypothetical protein